MLSVTGPRSNLMARTCRESHAKEMSTFILHFIETVVFSSVLFLSVLIQLEILALK